MYGNGVGTGPQIVMTQEKKAAVIQLVLRLGRTASIVVVVGATVLASVQFLTVAAAARAATVERVSVLFVPVL